MPVTSVAALTESNRMHPHFAQLLADETVDGMREAARRRALVVAARVPPARTAAGPLVHRHWVRRWPRGGPRSERRAPGLSRRRGRAHEERERRTGRRGWSIIGRLGALQGLAGWTWLAAIMGFAAPLGWRTRAAPARTGVTTRERRMRAAGRSCGQGGASLLPAARAGDRGSRPGSSSDGRRPCRTSTRCWSRCPWPGSWRCTKCSSAGPGVPRFLFAMKGQTTSDRTARRKVH